MAGAVLCPQWQSSGCSSCAVPAVAGAVLCPQVWISLAQFELSAGQDERLQHCRQVYEEANKAMRSCEEKEERLMLLEAWRAFEEEFGTAATKDRIDKLMPEKIKKRRKLQAEDGVRRGDGTCAPWRQGVANMGSDFLLVL